MNNFLWNFIYGRDSFYYSNIMPKQTNRFHDIPIKKLLLAVMIFLNIILTATTGTGLFTVGKASGARTYNSSTSIELEMTYSVNLQSFSLSQTNIRMWTGRFNNWSTGQNSTLLELRNKNNANYQYDPNDRHNNSYDYFQKSLGLNEKMQIEFSYKIELKGMEWEIPDNITLGQYNTGTQFYQNYTKAYPYLEVNDPGIQSKASELTEGVDSIAEMIENIYFFVVKNMSYTQMSGSFSKGAKWALENLEGDCSEFSSLMIALLRSAGIPARKALGIGLVEGDASAPNLLTDIRVGTDWTYNNSNMPAHAWVQYFIPSIGWVTADPTWGQALYEGTKARGESTAESYAEDYLHKKDYLHLISTIGDWWEEGIKPEIEVPNREEDGLAEFALSYLIFEGNSAPDYDYTFEFEVVGMERDSNSGSGLTLLFLAGGGVILVIVVMAALVKKKKQKEEWNVM